MTPDDELCLCFHVTRRKLENFARRRPLRVASQLAECGGAGTGCGWCVPLLTQIFERRGGELAALSAEEHRRRRAAYVRAGGGVPPAGATPVEES